MNIIIFLRLESLILKESKMTSCDQGPLKYPFVSLPLKLYCSTVVFVNSFSSQFHISFGDETWFFVLFFFLKEHFISLALETCKNAITIEKIYLATLIW